MGRISIFQERKAVSENVGDRSQYQKKNSNDENDLNEIFIIPVFQDGIKSETCENNDHQMHYNLDHSRNTEFVEGGDIFEKEIVNERKMSAEREE